MYGELPYNCLKMYGKYPYKMSWPIEAGLDFLSYQSDPLGAALRGIRRSCYSTRTLTDSGPPRPTTSCCSILLPLWPWIVRV